MRIDRADLLGNAVRASDFDWKLELSRLGKPVDRDVWNMTPQELNAEYDPMMNQITFPAAVLQPPLFDPANDPAVNYGSIGAAIGHEIDHGFDDEGREFDASGRLRDWWTAEAARSFTDRTRSLREQYDRYEPLPGIHINGDLTMGENIGDLGGLEMAYVAYRRYVAEHGEPPLIDGLTGDQRFFLAYAQTWRRKLRDGAPARAAADRSAQPAQVSASTGSFRNLDAWYAAFDIQPVTRSTSRRSSACISGERAESLARRCRDRRPAA
jgi:endothelin-converting enzyme/putative endopeptidase